MRPYPFGPHRALDIDPAYAELRRDEPMVRVQPPYGEQAWLATRHADIKAVLGDPRFSRAVSLTRDEPRMFPESRDFGMLSMDPPEHTRLHKLVSKAFTARRIEQLRPRVRELANDLLDDMAKAGAPADVRPAFAIPLPLTVICELLGVPVDERDQFSQWASCMVATTSLTPEQIEQYFGQLFGYIAGLVAQRKHQPQDDLLSALAAARDADDRLAEHEVVQLTMGLLGAGMDSTASQLCNFIYTLLRRPDQLAILRETPELLATAVEELMRFLPASGTPMFARYALEDVEVGGVTVRKGEAVLCEHVSANRDEAVYEEPDRLDLTRRHNPHLAFGHGPHFCTGAQFARLVLQEGIATLFTTFQDLRLATPEIPWRDGYFSRGPEELLVTW